MHNFRNMMLATPWCFKQILWSQYENKLFEILLANVSKIPFSLVVCLTATVIERSAKVYPQLRISKPICLQISCYMGTIQKGVDLTAFLGRYIEKLFLLRGKTYLIWDAYIQTLKRKSINNCKLTIMYTTECIIWSGPLSCTGVMNVRKYSTVRHAFIDAMAWMTTFLCSGVRWPPSVFTSHRLTAYNSINCFRCTLGYVISPCHVAVSFHCLAKREFMLLYCNVTLYISQIFMFHVSRI